MINIKYTKINFLIFFSLLILCSCKPSLENRVQGKWEVIEGGSFFFNQASSLEFSNGNVYMTEKSILGNITTPAEYNIKDGKIIVGNFIFEFVDNYTLETNNIPLMKFKIKKIKF